MKHIICTVCPRGCEMEVEESNGIIRVEKNGCPRGETYAKTEYTCPVRLFTSFVRRTGTVGAGAVHQADPPGEAVRLHRCFAGDYVAGPGSALYRGAAGYLRLWSRYRYQRRRRQAAGSGLKI